MTQFSAYLLFDGDCAAALQFYTSVFGGELSITTVSDSPMKLQFPEILHSRVMHARLRGSLVDLSASDWLHPTRQPQHGNMTCLYINNGTYAELKTYFDALADDADPTLLDPLTTQPFGIYGALTDKFGVRWMFQGNLTSVS